jgi:hypothetical protein
LDARRRSDPLCTEPLGSRTRRWGAREPIEPRAIGMPLARVEARAKVTGTAAYAFEHLRSRSIPRSLRIRARATSSRRSKTRPSRSTKHIRRTPRRRPISRLVPRRDRSRRHSSQRGARQRGGRLHDSPPRGNGAGGDHEKYRRAGEANPSCALGARLRDGDASSRAGRTTPSTAGLHGAEDSDPAAHEAEALLQSGAEQTKFLRGGERDSDECDADKCHRARDCKERLVRGMISFRDAEAVVAWPDDRIGR